MNTNMLTGVLPNQKSDLFGVLASSLCMVHCLATPLFFVVQACTVSCCETGPLWWRMMDYVFLVVSIAAIYYSAKMTSLDWMPQAMYGSWALLVFLIFNEALQLLIIPHVFIYIPAFSLVFLHLYNRKYCRCEEETCCTVEPSL